LHWTTVLVRRVVCASLVGSTMAIVPFLLFQLDSESTFVNSLQWVAKFLMIPGVIVGFAAAGGNGHSMNLWIMTLANGVVYAAVSYRLLAVWGMRSAKHRDKELDSTSASGDVEKS
jgi:uncharacterized membrane protein